LKPAAFEYVRPHSLGEALQAMARWGDECKPLAGGQSLVPLLNMRLAQPAVLIDLARVPELQGIRAGGTELVIGAMTRNVQLEHDGRMPPLIAAALPQVGHFQIRNRGTIGGSLAHMDPAAEWPALALAFDARLSLASARGRRTVPVGEFIRGPLMTALEPDELLVEVVLPVDVAVRGTTEERVPPPPNPPSPGERKGFGFAEVARRPGDFALIGAACLQRAPNRVAVAVFATGTTPHRLPGLEGKLAAGLPDERELIEHAASEIQVGGDIHASADYRRHVGARLVARVVRSAWGGAAASN
jgi:carbon-monoxide dehydrogenase medium subunit